MMADKNGWAVGNFGTILHWNGSNWSSHASASFDNFYAVAGLPSGALWVMGTEIWTRSGPSWSMVESPVQAAANGIALTAPTQGWAVTSGGVLLRRDIPVGDQQTALPLLLQP